MTKQGCLEIRKEVSMKYNIKGANLRIDYRTVASVLVNGSKKKYMRCFIDECLLFHAGGIGYISSLTGAKEVVIVGDEWQIPYIERDGVCEVLFSSPRNFCKTTEIISCTRRCPIDVCYAVCIFYMGIYTTNLIEHSLCFLKLSDKHCFEDEPNTLYLTHTQVDKHLLLDKGLGIKSVVLTIHEAQGQTFDNVILVRFNKKHHDVYNSDEHAVVSITRHRKTFTYFSSASCVKDKVKQLINRVKECKISLTQWNQQQALRNEIGLEPDDMIKPKSTSKANG